MADLGRGVIAGLIATLVISMLMLLRLSTGVMSWFNPIEIMNLNAQKLIGTPSSAIVGWLIHFIVGAVIWGCLYALLADKLPGKKHSVRGLIFGLIAWLLVMITVFPLAGSGWFGMGFGIIVPIMTLATHLVFGLILGTCYGWLKSS